MITTVPATTDAALKEETLLVLPVSCGDYADLRRYLVIAILLHFLYRKS